MQTTSGWLSGLISLRLRRPTIRCLLWQLVFIGDNTVWINFRVLIDCWRAYRWLIGFRFAVDMNRHRNRLRRLIWVRHRYYPSCVTVCLGVGLLTPRVRCAIWQLRVVGNRVLRLLVRQGRVFIRLDGSRNWRWRFCLYINISIVVRH